MAPPFCPIIYGNLHILPNPTAEPTAVTIKAYFDVQFGLFLPINYSLILLQIYYTKIVKNTLIVKINFYFNIDLIYFTTPSPIAKQLG